MKLLEGEIAIVTGGGRGFGRSIGVALAAQGAAVCLVSRNRHQLKKAIASIHRHGGSGCAAVGELTRPSDVKRVVAKARDQLGSPTILVSAAGVPGPFGPFWETDSDSWWKALTLHVRAPALLLRHVLPGMIERGKGRVVLVSSRAGNGIHAHLSAYCVGKAAQTRLAALVDRETREFGVRVFAIDPGLAFTQMASDTVHDPDARRYLPKMVERLSSLSKADTNDLVLEACGNRCVQLVSGRYDALGGCFLDSDADLDELRNREPNLALPDQQRVTHLRETPSHEDDIARRKAQARPVLKRVRGSRSKA